MAVRQDVFRDASRLKFEERNDPMDDARNDGEWYEVFHSMRGRYLDLVASVDAQIDEAILCFLDVDPPSEGYVHISLLSRLNLNEKIDVLGEAIVAAGVRERYPDLVKRLHDMRAFRNKAAHDRIWRSMQRVAEEDGAVSLRSFTEFRGIARGRERATDVSKEDFEERIAEAEQLFNDVAFGLREEFLEYAEHCPQWEKTAEGWRTR